MTDWFTVAESIHNAMQAVDKAHDASESLREKTDRESVERFQTEMKTLCKHLKQMQAILSHEDTYAMDELAAALGNMLGSGPTYHRIPHYEIKQNQ